MVLVFIGTAKPLASFSVAPAFVRLGSALLFFLCGISVSFLLNPPDRRSNIPQAIQLFKTLNMQMKGFFLLAFLHGKSLKYPSCPSFLLFNFACFKSSIAQA